jgi:hypothetical protein
MEHGIPEVDSVDDIDTEPTTEPTNGTLAKEAVNGVEETFEYKDMLSLAKHELVMYEKMWKHAPEQLADYLNSRIEHFHIKVETLESQERQRERKRENTKNERAIAVQKASDEKRWTQDVFKRELGEGGKIKANPLHPDGSEWEAMRDLESITVKRIGEWKSSNSNATNEEIKGNRERIKLAAFVEKIDKFSELDAQQYCGIFKAAKKHVVGITWEHFKELDKARCLHKRACETVSEGPTKMARIG